MRDNQLLRVNEGHGGCLEWVGVLDPMDTEKNVLSAGAAMAGAIEPGALQNEQIPSHAAYAAGQAAWPKLSANAAAFGRYVEGLGFGGGVPEIRAADLYLVHGCIEKAPGAIGAFEVAHRQTIENAARTVDVPPAFVDEVKQRLREILFVSKEGSRPRISQYSGRGPLAGWAPPRHGG